MERSKAHIGWLIRAGTLDGSPDRLFCVGCTKDTDAEDEVRKLPNIDGQKVKAERLLTLHEMAKLPLKHGEVVPY